MPYTPTEWENEVPAVTPVRYTLRNADDEVIYDNVRIDLKTDITPGTPLNAANLNKIEQGIKGAQDTADAQIITEKLIDKILSADADGRAKMEDGFVTLLKLAADLRFQKLYEFVADGSSLMDWNNIPQTFRHLILIYTGVSSATTPGWNGVDMRINGDDGVNYVTHFVKYTDPGLNWTWDFGITNPHNEGLFVGALPSQNAGNLPPGSGLVVFPDYRGTTYDKSCFGLLTLIGTYVSGFILSTSRRGNSEPITRLTGVMSTGNYPRAGSLFSLYGFN